MAFSYYRSIVIDHTQCGSSNSSAFPVLVSLSDTTLKSVGNGGHVQNSNGYDIQFFADSGLTTRIAAERESYNASSGSYIGWVPVGTLSASSDLTIYIAYGDASIIADPNSALYFGTAYVWNSHYKAVYHFNEGTGTSLGDSTGNLPLTMVNNPSPTWVTGKVSGGLNTMGTVTDAEAAGWQNSGTSLVVTGDFTQEIWLNINSVQYNRGNYALFSQWNGSGWITRAG